MRDWELGNVIRRKQVMNVRARKLEKERLASAEPLYMRRRLVSVVICKCIPGRGMSDDLTNQGVHLSDNTCTFQIS
jgi:hypothetical protein